MIALPEPRGAVTELLLNALPAGVSHLPVVAPTDAEDLQLALYLCYELHYRGLPGVDDRWEWEPSLLALRAELEAEFEAELRRAVPLPQPRQAMDVELREIEAADDGPPLSRHLERKGTLDQYLEFVVHRSAYQLKEADPHSWALPRLHGGPKAAMVEIQADEYGGGDPARIHAQLFARAMDALGLDSRYGAYVDHLPAVTLATVNLMSMFGLHRRLRGAIVGHLALFEMTSSVPNRRYANGLRRLGFDGDALDFYDEHVVADAVHENVAAVDLAGGLAKQDPTLAPDILWGAAALVELESRFARHLLDAWTAGESSLRRPIEPPAAVAGSAASPAAQAR
ncbi:MAG TPA: iron-containing redox enzyme family protein [Solirubrobacteraceae bacterium]|nr:iron-containing redox enzyme family protein [Solirubrobacteraceae bacterium]